jgi:hypothetical protein|tara:strand:+ start:1825 stop:3135 length:1311 start_codon:yes stop_codon:yes gene_type:complete
MNQVTQAINTQLITPVVGTSFRGGAEGAAGPTGADGVEGPHYAEVMLFTDPALSSPPTAPTATITWFTGVLSSVTAGWSQTPPTIDPTSTDTVYYSKIIFKDSIAPFATTTETGNTPVALYDFTNLPVSEENFTTVLKGKLDGIEALADVTDVINVTAAGALMDSELTDIVSVKALDQGVATTDSPTFVNVTADMIQLTGGTGTQGQVSWNADEETLDLINNGAVLQMGQEMHVHARNNTGVTIAEGVPVMANGTLGASGRILITPMVGSVQANAKYLIGITTEEIATSTDGKATQFGKVRGIDTTGTPYSETWVDGDVLWIDPVTTGGLTNVEPTSTSVMAQSVAFVVYAHTTVGELMVRASGQDEHEPLIHTVLKTGSTMTGTLGVPTVDFGDWTVTETGGSLYFATLGVNKMKLTAAGNLEITGTLTQSATIT